MNENNTSLKTYIM